MTLTSGPKLGPYEVVSPLGVGGMGEVYRARDTRLDRAVAIKILPTHLSDNPEFKQRFEREARTVSSLNHPHICHLYDIGSQDGTDYLVMQFLDGETLAERLRRGALPLPELLKIGIEVAEALEIAQNVPETWVTLFGPKGAERRCRGRSVLLPISAERQVIDGRGDRI
jgi:eukaryotic-like serine/threonine-protein kinase